MEQVPSGVPLSFEITLDAPSLFVAMKVYDDSGGSPILVQGPSAMANVLGNTYRGKFTATADKSYLILKAVYTDGTFTTLHPDYSQGTETIYAKDPNVSVAITPGFGGPQLSIETPNTLLAIEGPLALTMSIEIEELI
jgi:hypothetical protein